MLLVSFLLLAVGGSARTVRGCNGRGCNGPISEGPDSTTTSGPSLDPEDWEAFRALAHTALDEAIRFLQSVRENGAWRPMPESVQRELVEAVPVHPQGLESVYREFLERVLPYGSGNVHPRFWGWVHGSGLASGVVSELLAAAMDSNCGGRDHAGIHVERAVIEWCKTIFSFPAAAKGVLLTGTSMANLAGLAVARNARSGGVVRRGGLRGLAKDLVAYASAEAHDSVGKALEILGHGRESLRRVPVDRDFRIELPALRKRYRRDREAGKEPFCVVGTAGSVNTGAIDDLEALAAICREEDLWLHVDGAFGALAVLVDALRPRLAGLEHADSLAFDFHSGCTFRTTPAACWFGTASGFRRPSRCGRIISTESAAASPEAGSGPPIWAPSCRAGSAR